MGGHIAVDSCMTDANNLIVASVQIQPIFGTSLSLLTYSMVSNYSPKVGMGACYGVIFAISGYTIFACLVKLRVFPAAQRSIF